MSNEILETKEEKKKKTWSFMVQIHACYRNKIELWEFYKQNKHLPSDD